MDIYAFRLEPLNCVVESLRSPQKFCVAINSKAVDVELAVKTLRVEAFKVLIVD